jgi:hypothetical protein
MERENMNLFSKKLPVMAAALFAAVSLCGAQDTTQPKDYDQGHEVDAHQMMAGYNAPARVDVQGSWDFFIDASYIYWQPREHGLEVGYTVADADVTNNQGSVLHQGFDFKSGFKVGMGMNFERDNWVTDVHYTRLVCDHHTTHTAPSGYHIEALWLEDTDNMSYVSSAWKFKYNMLDWNLGRPFYCGTKLSFAPFIGVRGGWIGQHFNLSYTTVADSAIVHSYSRINSWLVGPRVGIGSSWMLGEGFRLFGDIDGGLYYQRSRTHYQPYDADDVTVLAANMYDKTGAITPNIDLDIGLGWGAYFADNGWHFDLSAAYEFNYYWNQNRMSYLKDLYNTISGDLGDLMIQGLTVKARLDF